MSQERCEATVKLLEVDKGRLAKECDELEQEVASLQKAHDLAQKTRHTALEERTKVSFCASICGLCACMYVCTCMCVHVHVYMYICKRSLWIGT